MKRGMTIEYLKYRADLNFEVDFEVNDAIGMIVTKWDLGFIIEMGQTCRTCIFKNFKSHWCIVMTKTYFSSRGVINPI